MPTDRNRCETVIWLHKPNVTSRSMSTFGLIHAAASFHPNARQQHRGARTTCLRIVQARSGMICQLPRAGRIERPHTIDALNKQITQTNCAQIALKTQIIVQSSHWFAFCI